MKYFIFSLLILSHSAFATKPLLTGGLSQIEGSGGGGLTPWALIAGLQTRDQVGLVAHTTRVQTQEFDFESNGFAIGIWDRVELSFSQATLNTLDVGSEIGLSDLASLSQSTAGLKLRLYGNALIDQDSWLPQVSLGFQQKTAHEKDLVESLGADSNQGLDIYLAFTKFHLSSSLLYNLTIRSTSANQTGLIGFGSSDDSSAQLVPEFSLGYLLNRSILVGIEYRAKPNNLDFSDEDPWTDFFIAWQPQKNISLTLAYAELGTIATVENQSGLYSSLQIGF